MQKEIRFLISFFYVKIILGDNMKLNKMYDKLTGKQTIVIAIFFALFVLFALPFVSTLTTELIGVSESPDLLFSFDLSKLYQLRNSYGSEGRRIYIILRFTFDIVWPLIYALFLISLSLYLAKRVDLKYKHKVAYITLLAVFFDLCENILASIFMAIYPVKSDILGWLIMSSSMLKWSFISLAFLIVLYLLLLNLVQKIKDH